MPDNIFDTPGAEALEDKDNQSGSNDQEAAEAQTTDQDTLAKEAGAGEEQATKPGEKPEQPRLYAGKYKSPEDLEQGYLNLQTLLGRRQAAMQEFQQELFGGQQAGAAPGQQGQGAAQPDEAQIRHALEERFREDPLGTMMAVADHIAQRRFQSLETRLGGQELVNTTLQLSVVYPDFEALAPKMGEILKARPYWRQVVLQNPAALEDLYLAAKASFAGEAVEQARAAGRQEAAEALRAKAGAVTEGQGARQAPKQKTREEEIIDEIFRPEAKKTIFD